MEKSNERTCPNCGNDGMVSVLRLGVMESQEVHWYCAGAVGCHIWWKEDGDRLVLLRSLVGDAPGRALAR